MRRRTIQILGSSLLTFGWLTGAEVAGSSSGTVPPPAASAQAAKPELNKSLAIEQLPPPVQTTLLRESDGRAISGIEFKRKNSREYYRAQYRDPEGKKQRIEIAPDGRVLARK